MQPSEPDSPATATVAIPAEGPRTRHYDGLPPEMTGGVDTRREMPPAVLVLVAPYGDGRWDLDRYAGDGSYAGSSMHDTWGSLVEQLQSEYLSDLAFTPVPAEVVDVRTYASELSAQQSER